MNNTKLHTILREGRFLIQLNYILIYLFVAKIAWNKFSLFVNLIYFTYFIICIITAVNYFLSGTPKLFRGRSAL